MLSVLTFRTPDEAVAKANNTTYGLSAGIWTEKGSRILKIANQLRAGVVWANTFNKFDPTSPFGGYKQSGYGREGGRHGLTGYLKGATRSERPAGRPQDLQALRQRGVPAVGVRAQYEVTDTKGHFLANAAWASRKDARDAVVAARGAFGKWAGTTAYNRGQVLYRVAEVMEGRHVQFCEEVAAGEGIPRARRGPPSTPPSTAGSGTPGGPTSSPPSSAGRTRSPARTSTSRCPSRPASSPSWRRSTPRCSGLVSVLAPVLAGGNTAVVVTSKERPLPAVTLGEVLATSDVPGGVVNLLTGDAAELGTWLAEHADVDAIDLTGAPSGRAMELEREAAGTVKRVLRPQRPRAGLDRRPRPRPDDAVPGDQDGLAPDRRLTPVTAVGSAGGGPVRLRGQLGEPSVAWSCCSAAPRRKRTTAAVRRRRTAG